jgi:hypothetical protein
VRLAPSAAMMPRRLPSPICLDPVLGLSRPDGEWPRHCSNCVAEIPEDVAAPLMLFRTIGAGTAMWAYCADCSDAIAAFVRRGRREPPERKA